jgi:hypothetical protein
VATSYTEVPRARSKSEFFSAVRAGDGIAAGTNGSYLRLTKDIFAIAAALIQEKPGAALFAPLAPLVPVVTLAILIHDAAFARHWARNLRQEATLNLPGGRVRSADQMLERFA